MVYSIPFGTIFESSFGGTTRDCVILVVMTKVEKSSLRAYFPKSVFSRIHGQTQFLKVPFLRSKSYIIGGLLFFCDGRCRCTPIQDARYNSKHSFTKPIKIESRNEQYDNGDLLSLPKTEAATGQSTANAFPTATAIFKNRCQTSNEQEQSWR